MPETFNWIDYLTIPPATPESLWELEDIHDLGNVVEEVGNYETTNVLLFIPSRLTLPPLYNLEKNINGGFKEQQYG